MKFQHTNQNGSVINCQSVDRRLLDSIWSNFHPPQPPMIQVEVWGGVLQDVYQYNDSSYEIAVGFYRLEIENKILDIFRPKAKIELSAQDEKEFKHLKTLGVDLLRDVILQEDEDRNEFLNLCLYYSTVTEKAILEAITRFKVSYAGTPIEKLAIPGSFAERAQLFEDWQAAKYGNISWQRFCKLSGPEQSEYVAYMRLDIAIKYQLENERIKK